MFRICSSYSVELLLGARRGLVRVITAKPPHEAATKVKPLTGNCPWDLLFFKAPASQSCLLVQSLIAHLHALNPCTAGKAKHCPDCTEISRATGEPKAQPREPLPPTGQAHIPQLFRRYPRTPPTQTPSSLP